MGWGWPGTCAFLGGLQGDHSADYLKSGLKVGSAGLLPAGPPAPGSLGGLGPPACPICKARRRVWTLPLPEGPPSVMLASRILGRRGWWKAAARRNAIMLVVLACLQNSSFLLYEAIISNTATCLRVTGNTAT